MTAIIGWEDKPKMKNRVSAVVIAASDYLLSLQPEHKTAKFIFHIKHTVHSLYTENKLLCPLLNMSVTHYEVWKQSYKIYQMPLR